MVVAKKDMESQRKRFIEKGGSTASSKDTSEHMNICLRIPKNMVQQIDSLVKEKAGYSRTTWILQAIQKQLEMIND
jgi:predicted DNA-binding protein